MKKSKNYIDKSNYSAIITFASGADVPDEICESAGTGRQARLRGVCQLTWEFKSPLSHHQSLENTTFSRLFSFHFPFTATVPEQRAVPAG